LILFLVILLQLLRWICCGDVLMVQRRFEDCSLLEVIECSHNKKICSNILFEHYCSCCIIYLVAKCWRCRDASEIIPFFRSLTSNWKQQIVWGHLIVWNHEPLYLTALRHYRNYSLLEVTECSYDDSCSLSVE